MPPFLICINMPIYREPRHFLIITNGSEVLAERDIDSLNTAWDLPVFAENHKMPYADVVRERYGQVICNESLIEVPMYRRRCDMHAFIGCRVVEDRFDLVAAAQAGDRREKSLEKMHPEAKLLVGKGLRELIWMIQNGEFSLDFTMGKAA